MLYAAREEIKKKDKLIELLKGGEVNESKDCEHSFSTISFCGNELMESVQELERIKEQLANETRKNLKLHIENNEKQSILDKEKRENEKNLVQISYHKTNCKILEEEICIREENIRIHAVKIASVEEELLNTIEKLKLSKEEIEKITKENGQYSTEIKSLQQQVINYKSLELQNNKLQNNREYEINLTKKLQDENNQIREKLEITLAKIPNIEQLKENLKESIQYKEKMKWLKEKNKILADFEEYINKHKGLEGELTAYKESILNFHSEIAENERILLKKIKVLDESNKKFKCHYESLNIKYAEVYSEYLIEKEKNCKYIKQSENLETHLMLSIEKINNMEQKMNQARVYLNTPNKNTKGIFNNHFRTTIKGGQSLNNFTPSPMKDFIKNESLTKISSVGKENIKYIY